MRYTHIVKRESGYVAGWLHSEEEAAAFAVECNTHVPSDPAHVEELEGDEAWDDLLAADALAEKLDTQFGYPANMPGSQESAS